MTCDVTHPAIATKLIAARNGGNPKNAEFRHMALCLMFHSASEQLACGKAVNDLPVLAGVRGKDASAPR